MPNRKNRERRRRGGMGVMMPSLISLLVLVAVILIVMLIQNDPFAPEQNDELPFSYSDALNFEEQADPEPLILGATETSKSEEKVVDTAKSEPISPPADHEGFEGEVPEENAEKTGNHFMPEPEPGDYFLPVLDRALRTPDDRPMIAITIDGCDNPEVMGQILNIAQIYNAELTLFPTGDALMNMASGFRVCVDRLNYEIENCAYDAGRRDYTMSSGELALQLWRQSVAASYAISRDYQQHFYRPQMKQSDYDQRTHFFIRKLGFIGIASYTHSYRNHDVDYLVNSLANGNIYQFDMSEESMAVFEPFINEASRKGYKLATMNELFGLEENEKSNELTIDQQTLPGMDDYIPTYYDLKLNYRTNAVYALQTRLMDLGYISAEENETIRADGIYGASTSTAVSAFQARVGIVATGNADVETQQKLFAEDAPAADE